MFCRFLEELRARQNETAVIKGIADIILEYVSTLYNIHFLLSLAQRQVNSTYIMGVSYAYPAPLAREMVGNDVTSLLSKSKVFLNVCGVVCFALNLHGSLPMF